MKNPMKDLWLDESTVQQITGWSVRTLLRKAKHSIKWRYRPGKEKGKNGRRVREFHAGWLPAAAQQKFAQLLQARMAARNLDAPLSLVPDAESKNKQCTLFPIPPKIPAERRAALPAAQREQADERLQIITPLFHFRDRTNGHKPTFRCQDGKTISSLDELAAYVAGQRGISPRTVWRYYTRFKALGYVGLADEPHRNKGESKFFAQHPEIAAVVENKYLIEGLSVQLCYEAVKIRYGAKAPGRETVRRFLKTLPAPIVKLGRQGERTWTEDCAPYIIRDPESVRANQVWVADHGVHDCWCRNDGYFPSVPANAAIRPWMTGILDMRTRKAVGATWCATPSSRTIGTAMREGLLRFGAPDIFLADHGKDFLKIGRIDFSPETIGVLHRLGIKAQHCLPKHPQSKLIERFFGTLRTRFDMTWRPFYCGSKPSNRPDECAEVLREHAALLKAGRGDSSPLPPASQFVREARWWVEIAYNNEFRHSGRGMGDRSPNEVFDELLPPDARRPVNEGDLDVLLWERQKRKVGEGGCLELFGTKYEPADQESGSRLFLEITRDILVCCDPNNLGSAVALDLDGRYIGRLRSQKLLAHGPASIEDVKASLKLRRRYLRATRECLALVGYAAANVGDMTEAERRRMRAGIAPQRASASPLQLPAALPVHVTTAAEPAYIDQIVEEFREYMQPGEPDNGTES